MTRRAPSAAAGQGPAFGGWRACAGLAVAAALCALLALRLATLDPAAVGAALAGVPPLAWALAAGLSALSLAAAARQDAAIHRHLATRVPAAAAHRAGFVAVALSQVAGFGLVTGALLRWRMLPGMTLPQAMRLTLLVALAFLAGWAFVALALLAALGPTGWRAGLVALPLVLLALAALSLRPPHPQWPGLRIQTRILSLTAADVLCAGLAFWVLMPGEVPVATVLPAVVLAIGAGLVSGSPGGIGAFELALLALLPGQPEAALIATVLAWRLVYYVAPALWAAVLALRGPAPLPLSPRPGAPAPLPPRDLPFAEAQLIAQGQLAPIAAAGLPWVGAALPQTLILLRMPLAPMPADPCRLSALAAHARAEGRGAALYKAPARLAALARRAGWRVLPVAREAVLVPARFRLETPARAALRRKLRRAAAAGIIARAEEPDPAELAALNAAWVAARGAERGLSMGRFEAGYLARQRVYVARIGPRPVGFASFHCTGGEWALDLLRPHPAAPDGTAHALIAAALADAARAGLPRFSLAAVPEAAFADARGLAGLPARRPAAGLWQFKAAFDPAWERLYLAAPGWLSLALAAHDLRRAILQPPPPARLPPPMPPPMQPHPGAAPADAAPAGADPAPPPEIAFASPPAAWHRKTA